jgi:hypothetical protein
MTEQEVNDLILKMGSNLTVRKARIEALEGQEDKPIFLPFAAPNLSISPAPTPTPEKPKRRGKFNNKITIFDGQTFHSLGERDRWIELLRLQAIGQLRGLERQVEFPLIVNGERISTYTADFCYWEIGKAGEEIYIVEDFKNPSTAKRRDYVIRKKLLYALYGHKIRETMKPPKGERKRK